MAYRRYHQSDISVKSETENVKFKRYIENEQKRFLQYIDGTITHIYQEDFEEGITVLPSYAIHSLNNLQYIELPDTITTFEIESLNNLNSLELIVFPKNVKTIKLNLDNGNVNMVADFSKATQVPTLSNLNEEGTAQSCFTAPATIKVPSNLYNSWIAATNWADIKNKIVSV